jgi:hypothetical protein
VPFLVVQAVVLALAALVLAALAAALLLAVLGPVVHPLLALHTLYRILLPLLWDFHIYYKTFFIPSLIIAITMAYIIL